MLIDNTEKEKDINNVENLHEKKSEIIDLPKKSDDLSILNSKDENIKQDVNLKDKIPNDFENAIELDAEENDENKTLNKMFSFEFQ